MSINERAPPRDETHGSAFSCEYSKYSIVEKGKSMGSDYFQETQSHGMKYVMYIVQCADGSLYVGCTNNVEKRLKEHNESKRGAHYTKIRRPTTLIYSESFLTFRKARQREAEIKKWPRKKKLDLINR